MSVMGPAGDKNYFLNDPLTADGAGNISVRLRAPDLNTKNDSVEDVGLGAFDQQRADQGAPPEEVLAGTLFKLSIFDVFVAPWDSHKVDPKKVTTFRAYGFEGLGPVLYAHYFLKGKLKKTVRLGALTGDCGNLTKKMKQFPFRPVPPGNYRVDFDTNRAWSPQGAGIRYSHVKVPAKKAVR
jgi:hypothetical protein